MHRKEIREIIETRKACGENYSEAARRLGVDRKTVHPSSAGMAPAPTASTPAPAASVSEWEGHETKQHPSPGLCSDGRQARYARSIGLALYLLRVRCHRHPLQVQDSSSSICIGRGRGHCHPASPTSRRTTAWNSSEASTSSVESWT